MLHRYARLVPALLAVLLALPAVASDAPATVVVEDGVVVWTPGADYAASLLTVTTPGGDELRRSFEPGLDVRLDPAGDLGLADGVYQYELVLLTDETVEAGLRAVRQSGAFEVRGGAAVPSAFMDQTIVDDLIVQGSECVGQDCNTGENFGFDTIRLKENNLRIGFLDTSNSGSFPSNDWEITINDSNNGGANYFQVRDVTGNRNPFRIEAGAPTGALWVDDAGNVGIGKTTPVVEVHTADGDTPTLRLEQDGSSGFTPQTFDIASNEANFFIRDVTNGSLLPFRIVPGARKNSVFMNSKGVGIQTESIQANFEVEGIANVSRRLLVGYADTSTAATNTTFQVASGLSRFDQTRVDGTSIYNGEADFRAPLTGRDILNFSGDYTNNAAGFVFRIRDTGQTGNPSLFELENTGDLFIAGALTQSSDVNRKENVVAVDPEAVLAGVAGLDIATWNYIANEDDVVHMGPMAQDFWRAFGLGHGETTITAVDADGVALASVQALHARSEAAAGRLEALEAENARLAAENAALAERLARIEARLADLD